MDLLSQRVFAAVDTLPHCTGRARRLDNVHIGVPAEGEATFAGTDPVIDDEGPRAGIGDRDPEATRGWPTLNHGTREVSEPAALLVAPAALRRRRC